MLRSSGNTLCKNLPFLNNHTSRSAIHSMAPPKSLSIWNPEFFSYLHAFMVLDVFVREIPSSTQEYRIFTGQGTQHVLTKHVHNTSKAQPQTMDSNRSAEEQELE